jgi:hypothetical protein
MVRGAGVGTTTAKLPADALASASPGRSRGTAHPPDGAAERPAQTDRAAPPLSHIVLALRHSIADQAQQHGVADNR